MWKVQSVHTCRVIRIKQNKDLKCNAPLYFMRKGQVTDIDHEQLSLTIQQDWDPLIDEVPRCAT